MTIRSNFPQRMILLIIIVHEFLSVTSKSQDDLCPKIHGVLCVKDVLVNILAASKQVNEIAKEIEQTIVSKQRTVIPLSIQIYFSFYLVSR